MQSSTSRGNRPEGKRYLCRRSNTARRFPPPARTAGADRIIARQAATLLPALYRETPTGKFDSNLVGERMLDFIIVTPAFQHNEPAVRR